MIDKLQERINRGNAAKRVLEDEMINAVLTEIGNDWTKEALRTCLVQPEGSLTMMRQVIALDVLKAKLQTIIANGREAERELEKMTPTK